MDSEISTLRMQREALLAFLAVQERKKQLEAPVGPDRKKAEDAARQTADSDRRKVDEDRRALDKVRVETTTATEELMQAVNQSWNEVGSALRASELTHLLSDPSSFRIKSDGGDAGQALRRCQSTAADAQAAVQRAVIELREFNERRLFIFLGIGLAFLLAVVVIAVKFG